MVSLFKQYFISKKDWTAGLERPHTTRFPSHDGSDQTRYVTTGHRR